MYSCGSLAPKMRRGGGCADHLFRRPAEPWEKADGCVSQTVAVVWLSLNKPAGLTTKGGKKKQLINTSGWATLELHWMYHLKKWEELDLLQKLKLHTVFQQFLELAYLSVTLGLGLSWWCNNVALNSVYIMHSKDELSFWSWTKGVWLALYCALTFGLHN